MPIATGVNKQVGYKRETQWGQLAGNTGGALLRRVTANFNLTKETYESGEIRTDYQVADMRHGVRSVEGSLSGELSPGSYSEFFGAVLARDFPVSAQTILSLSITIASAAAVGGVATWNVTRATGSWLTDGVKIGDVVRFTAGSFNAANINKNMVVLSVTATVLNVFPLNGVAMAAEGTAVTGATLTIPKKTFAPVSGHTDRSYTFEEWYSDVPASEVFTGLKVNTASIALPATGLVTCDFGFMGKDMAQTGSTQYFTSPTAQGASGIFASVSGVLVVNGIPVALLTSLNININRNMQNATVVGSNSVAEMFEGRIVVDGDFSAYFENANFRDLFVNETEASIVAVLATGSGAAADFMSIVLPRIKVNSNTRDDGEQGITAQHSFTALLNTAGGAGVATERTTISIQDSQA